MYYWLFAIKSDNKVASLNINLFLFFKPENKCNWPVNEQCNIRSERIKGLFLLRWTLEKRTNTTQTASAQTTCDPVVQFGEAVAAEPFCLPCVDNRHDPLKRWKSHKINFPSLCKLTQKCLSIQATMHQRELLTLAALYQPSVSNQTRWISGLSVCLFVFLAAESLKWVLKHLGIIVMEVQHENVKNYNVIVNSFNGNVIFGYTLLKCFFSFIFKLYYSNEK